MFASWPEGQQSQPVVHPCMSASRQFLAGVAVPRMQACYCDMSCLTHSGVIASTRPRTPRGVQRSWTRCDGRWLIIEACRCVIGTSNPRTCRSTKQTHQLKLCNAGSAKVLIQGEFKISYCSREEIYSVNPYHTEFKFPKITAPPLGPGLQDWGRFLDGTILGFDYTDGFVPHPPVEQRLELGCYRMTVL
ncbi:hypothetical protein ABBQ38_008707 [Trebouxia sp. C0009 RCD-2024]